MGWPLENDRNNNGEEDHQMISMGVQQAMSDYQGVGTKMNGDSPTPQSHGWLVGQGHPSEKYEFVNWDDLQPNSHGKIKNGNQTTNQMVLICFHRHKWRSLENVTKKTLDSRQP